MSLVNTLTSQDRISVEINKALRRSSVVGHKDGSKLE